MKRLKGLSYFTCLIMFAALLGGAVVTKTGSGLECGNEWPLCNGKLVPAYTVGQLIEWGHRAVSGLAGLLSLASAVAFWRYGRRRDLRLYALLTLLFVVVQAAMGALAVVRAQSAAVMALHMGFSLIAFASSLMLALGARRTWLAERGASALALSSARSGPGTAASAPLPRSFRMLTWTTALYAYLVVYIGAFVSHTSSSGGCSGWPLCNGELVPELSGGTLIAFVHRSAALLLLLLVALLGHLAFWRHGRSYPELRGLGAAAAVLCLLQVFSGAAVVWTMNKEELYIFAALAHIVLIAGLFGVLAYMSVRVWQLGAAEGGSAQTRIESDLRRNHSGIR